jgi:hypothetical protein
MNAVPLHPALNARQEIDEESRRIMGMAQRVRRLAIASAQAARGGRPIPACRSAW